MVYWQAPSSDVFTSQKEYDQWNEFQYECSVHKVDLTEPQSDIMSLAKLFTLLTIALEMQMVKSEWEHGTGEVSII